MNRPQYILLPANTAFIFLTLFITLMLNLQPWGNLVGIPDFVAIALIFWGVHQPRRVSIGIAFSIGLIMDVNNATLLGETALAYTLLSYLATTLHRRMLWFPPARQVPYVLILLLFTQIFQILLQYIVTGRLPDWFFFLGSLIAAALWPAITWLFMAPQRRAVDKDENRPI